MFDGVIFDLDGTLTDPAEGIIGSFRYAVASVGHPAPDELDLSWIIGPPMPASIIEYGIPTDLQDAANEAFHDRHVSKGLFEARLHDGISDLLARLRDAGVGLAVATLKPTEQAITTVEHFGIAQYFDIVCGRNPEAIFEGKVGQVARAIESLGSPVRVAMVGDRIQDVEGGRANGATTVVVGWGYAQPGEFDIDGPDHQVASIDALAKVLLG